MINLKRNRLSIQSQPPIPAQPAGKLSRLKTGLTMFSRLTSSGGKHPVPLPSPREDRFPVLHLFRDHSSDNLNTFLHSDKLKMLYNEKHSGKTRPRFFFSQPDDKYVLKNAQTVSNDATDGRLLALRQTAIPRQTTVLSMTSSFSFTPKRKTGDSAQSLPSPISSVRGYRKQQSVASGSLTAKEFAKEAGIEIRDDEEDNDDDDDEAQSSKDSSARSREAVFLSAAVGGMTVRSSGGKSSNSAKAKLNIWEDNFWRKPGTEDEPPSPPLSPSSLGPAEFSSSSRRVDISHSPTTDIFAGLDVSQATHHSSPLPTPTPQLKYHDIPLSSSYPNNNLDQSTFSFQRFLDGHIPGSTMPGDINIPPPPKDDSIVEPPFLAHLRRATMCSTSDTFAGAEHDCPPTQTQDMSASSNSKPAMIRKGRFVIVLGGQAKDAAPSLNPREVTHQHQHEVIPLKSCESEREHVREWRRKIARVRTSSDAGSSCFDDRSELSVKLDESAKE